MFLKQLSLTQFRNYQFQKFEFDARIVGICGANGVGKTNLLDAIHFLCFTRSYFSRTDAGSVKTGTEGFRIEGHWEMKGQDREIACILRETGKKECWVDGEQLTRFSSHIGRFPVVFIAPDDISLVSGGAEERRRFLDTLLSQLDPAYLQSLIRYQKILQERNGFLKNAAETGRPDLPLLDILDQQLAVHGEMIYEKRKVFLMHFIPDVIKQHQVISGALEKPTLFYATSMAEGQYLEKLKASRTRDLAVQRTLSGIHRDDIEISLNGMNFRQVASQGQRKSLLFALKLAEFTALQQSNGFSPLLLLDDIFEKLDADRMENLLHRVCNEGMGQVFLTDTHQGRIRDVMRGIGFSSQHLELA